MQLTGLHHLTAVTANAPGNHAFYTQTLGMRLVKKTVTGAELHVMVEPGLAAARPGAGGVHHVAFRTPDEDSYRGWAERLHELRIPSSGPVDRYYFKSLYFREPNGILFEIATDGPGFATDEPQDRLGERLALPPFLEPRRSEIERNLKPL